MQQMSMQNQEEEEGKTMEEVGVDLVEAMPQIHFQKIFTHKRYQ